MYAKLAVAVVAAVIGSGCIRSATLITVKPDGSGTIEQTVLMNAAALKGMLGGLGGAQQSRVGAINEDDAQAAAARRGRDLRVVRTASRPTTASRAAKALYAFTDISKVRVDQDPNLTGVAPAEWPPRRRTTTRSPSR